MVNQQATVKALINLGCTHICILENKVKELGIPTKLVSKPFKVLNADRTPSSHKLITYYVNITLDTHGHKEQIKAVVTILDSANIFLGHD
ncbi:hypothetical protein AN958_08375 [Leucoagaricus sp. SymC.cos]|nr:hypothetical protein AN958_08375 [Leucoagaricus sp. SymC.cos]